MTVGALIRLLSLCPQDAKIELYYDGAPRLIPDCAYLTQDSDGEPLVVLGENVAMYYYPEGAKLLFGEGTEMR